MKNGFCSTEDYRKAGILRRQGYKIEIFEFKVISLIPTEIYGYTEVLKSEKQLIAYKGDRPEIKELDDYRHCPYLMDRVFNNLVINGE